MIHKTFKFANVINAEKFVNVRRIFADPRRNVCVWLLKTQNKKINDNQETEERERKVGNTTLILEN